MKWPFSKPEDLKPQPFPTVTWDGTADPQSLEAIRGYVIQQAQETGNWYLHNRRGKRLCGRAIRLVAILATTAAGVIPVLVHIFAYDGKPLFDPAWASIALALAGALVGLDYFFGYSTAWMRYMETQQKIARVVRQFQFDWEVLRAGWGTSKPTTQQVLSALARLKETALQVQQLVEDETNAWIAEFKSSIKLIDEAARAKMETPSRTAATVIVTNGAKVNGEWSLIVDDGAATKHRGERAAAIGLLPGAHKFTVEGNIGSDLKRDEVSAIVPPSGVVEITLNLK